MVVELVSPLLLLELLSFSAVVVEAVAVGGLAADLLGEGANAGHAGVSSLRLGHKKVNFRELREWGSTSIAPRTSISLVHKHHTSRIKKIEHGGQMICGLRESVGRGNECGLEKKRDGGPDCRGQSNQRKEGMSLTDWGRIKGMRQKERENQGREGRV